MEYRVENKYLVTDSNISLLDINLKKILSLDHLAQSKKYNIRSIYFDSIDNECFFENDAGADDRLKFRIRIYNCNKNHIKLEKKYKKNGYTKKESCDISLELCKKLIAGELLEYNECTNKILRHLYLKQRMNLYIPKIIVEYDRIAYVDRIGNVRVTFDTNVRASKKVNRFLEKNTYSKPILEDNKHILEVKYDEILPSYIKEIMQVDNFEKISFSKYYLSRLAFKEEVL